MKTRKIEPLFRVKVLVILKLCVTLQKSLGHARFEHDLGALFTPCGKGLGVLRHTTAREKDRARGR